MWLGKIYGNISWWMVNLMIVQMCWGYWIYPVLENELFSLSLRQTCPNRPKAVRSAIGVPWSYGALSRMRKRVDRHVCQAFLCSLYAGRVHRWAELLLSFLLVDQCKQQQQQRGVWWILTSSVELGSVCDQSHGGYSTFILRSEAGSGGIRCTTGIVKHSVRFRYRLVEALPSQ